MSYTVFFGALPFLCFFTKMEAERYIFEAQLVHPEYHLSLLGN